jgi:hypothetical protein
MKKKLEADLMSIAHRILKIKNKSDVNELFLETQKLYEKLSVLRFIEEHYSTLKPTIGHAELQQEIEDFYDRSSELPTETVIEMTESNIFPEVEEETVAKEQATKEKPLVEEHEAHESLDHEESPEVEIVTEEGSPVDEDEVPENADEEETVVEEFKADIQELQLEPEESDHENTSPEETSENLFPEEETPPPFKAAFELSEHAEAETPKQAETVQISFADLLGGNYNEPHFVKVDDIEALPPVTAFEQVHETTETKNVSLNDKLSKGIDIDLNDRIAFVKHLFGNSSEDYNRVLNQLITFNNFYETKNFIEEMVKPDYNDWRGKDDYAERFMDIIEKKFL